MTFAKGRGGAAKGPEASTSGSAPNGDGGSSVDQTLIRELAALLKETDLTEIEIERQGLRVRVSRQGGMAVHQVPMMLGPSVAPIAAADLKPADLATHPGAVHSPMVGTVYVAPAPGSAPFIKVGDMVTEGQTILIVEAMKTMNPIPAPRAGRVTQILVSDGQPVEYGETLMIVE